MVDTRLQFGADPILLDHAGYRADEHAKGHETTLAAFHAFGFTGPSQWLMKVGFLSAFGCWIPPKDRHKFKIVEPIPWAEKEIPAMKEGREVPMEKVRRKKETEMDRRNK